MLSFFITPSMCLLLCWWLWSKLSALSNGWICLNFPSFISTLGGFTYREKTEGDGFFQPCKIGLLGQNRRVVFSAGHSDMQLCRRKTCTNCSTPHGVAPLLFPFNRFLASPPTNSHANEDDDDGNPKCMGSFDVTGLARRQKMVGGSQHK